MNISEIGLGHIKVTPRLRTIDPNKVINLVESTKLLSLLNPTLTDTEYNLLTGNHRLEVFRIWGKMSIPTQVIDTDELNVESIQIDQNLILNQL